MIRCCVPLLALGVAGCGEAGAAGDTFRVGSEVFGTLIVLGVVGVIGDLFTGSRIEISFGGCLMWVVFAVIAAVLAEVGWRIGAAVANGVGLPEAVGGWIGSALALVAGVLVWIQIASHRKP